MHPYTTNAIAAQRVADWQAEAAVARQARQAQARRPAAPRQPGTYSAASAGGQKFLRGRLLGRLVTRQVLPN